MITVLVILQKIINKTMSNLTDRQLLEAIYLMLQQVLIKVNEIDNDDKQLGMNIFANIVGDMLMQKRE